MRVCADGLRADFQQFYGLDIDGMGGDYTLAHAAALAAQLPRESRCFRHDNPGAWWSEGEYMLAEIAYGIAILAWQRSKDGAKGVNKPRRIESPAHRAEMERRVGSTDFEHIDEVMNGDCDG